jgi:antirestriction protein ArdC
MLAVLSHEVITEKIVSALVENKIPWRNDYGFPVNVISRRRYGGVNALLLNIATEQHGFTSPYWATYSQWQAQGRTVRPRPENVAVGKWRTEIALPRSDKQLGRWSLFNLDQVDGGFAGLRNLALADPNQADRVIEATHANINFVHGTVAQYEYPPDDRVTFPLKEQFVQGAGGLAGYYNSLFHELMHWTEPRLGWEGDERERELRAEIGADFLTTELRLPRLAYELRLNHHNFLGRWMDMFCNDPTAIFDIADAAYQAAEYVLGCNHMAMPRHNPLAEVV